VHWSIPVQCELPPSHWEDHETTHPETGARLQYCRTGGAWRTLELRDGQWHRLEIPPPGGYCGQPDPDRPDVTCTWQYGHRLAQAHAAYVDGVWHQWPTLLPEPERRAGLDDAQLLRGLVFDQAAEIAELRAAIAKVQQELAQGQFTGTPGAAERQSRLLTRIENSGQPITTHGAHRIYRSWGWKGLSAKAVRGDLIALVMAGRLELDDSNPSCRRYRPGRTPRTKGGRR
jgi:hypothetical protein